MTVVFLQYKLNRGYGQSVQCHLTVLDYTKSTKTDFAKTRGRNSFLLDPVSTIQKTIHCIWHCKKLRACKDFLHRGSDDEAISSLLDGVLALPFHSVYRL